MNVGYVTRPATSADQQFITEMQYEALFVPPGDQPFPRSILDDERVRPYHVGFGSSSGDVGVVAETTESRLLGAAWVRRLDGYGFVDGHTPELTIAVVDEVRGAGVGTALLSDLLVSVPRCSLSVDTRNVAMRLYERCGFDTVRRDGEHTAVMLFDGVGRE